MIICKNFKGQESSSNAQVSFPNSYPINLPQHTNSQVQDKIQKHSSFMGIYTLNDQNNHMIEKLTLSKYIDPQQESLIDQISKRVMMKVDVLLI